MNRLLPALLAATVLGGCSESGSENPPAELEVRWDREQGPADRVASIVGLSGPEAVRNAPDQEVGFIATFGPGSGDSRDADGFVSRVDAETGNVASLRFAVGTDEHPLHEPRGMFLTGDTLWVADVDGVHGFHRTTGAALVFRDFTAFEPGFLNDIAQGPDGLLYVTDTGRSALYAMDGAEVTEVLAADSALGSPNGVTFDPARNALVLVPWTPGHRVRMWRPGDDTTLTLGSATPGRLDGVEAIDRRLLVASQTDSTLQLFDAGGALRVIKVAGPPADIGIDTRRRRVAVPYIALDRVDIWQLPE